MIQPLGIRQNNPGNIEKGASWKGLDPIQTHPRFARFVAPEYGIRAIAVTILTYYRSRKARDGSAIDTIREVIDRWAPSFENNTNAYVAHVDELHPAGADDMIDLGQYANMAPLVLGIIQHENGNKGPHAGGHWYTQRQIDEGLRLAGIVKPSRVDPVDVGAATAAAGAGGAGAAAALSEQAPEAAHQAAARAADIIDTIPLPGPAADPLAGATEVVGAAQQGLSPLAHLSVYVAIALAALAVGLVVLKIMRARKRKKLEGVA